MENVRKKLESAPQMYMFVDDEIKKADEVYEDVIKSLKREVIEIPRIILQQGEGKAFFEEFDLDVKNISLQPMTDEIYRKTLRTNEAETIASKGGVMYDAPDKMLVNELINHPEIDYDSCSGLLFKLVAQAGDKLKSYLSEEQANTVMRQNVRQLSGLIFGQMMEHFKFVPAPYEKPKVFAFSQIEEHHYSKILSDKLHFYVDTIEPTSEIPSKVFGGFAKSCHTKYKFDSKAEKDFSSLFEHDPDVIKWLRPAKAQFDMWYDNNQSKYEPDFIVETAECIYMVEVKAANEVQAPDTLDKARAGMLFCEMASDFTKTSGGKQWKYSLIPHDKVQPNVGVVKLMENYLYK